MASQRCPQCAINYPANFLTCLVKDCRTALLTSPHGVADPGWQEKVSKRNAQGGVDIHTDRRGQTWISKSDAERLAYIVEIGTILEVGDTFFEVSGWSPTKEAYWLEEVIVDGAADSLEPAMFLGPA